MHFHRLIVAAGLCALLAGAYAATSIGELEPTTGTWRVYRGSNFDILVCSNSSETAALQCAAADAERRATSTRYQIRYPNRYVRVTYSAPPPPPPAEQWTFCANEWQTCRFTGTRRVRYGANTTWAERDATDGVECRNSVFGDPLPGVTKRCELRAASSEPPATGSATLSWTPPTQNTDGTALTNLAGYRVSYGTSTSALTQTIQIANAGASAHTINNLAPGTYHFAVRAYNSAGAESASSNVVSKTVQ